jgi:hypothetical protein
LIQAVPIVTSAPGEVQSARELMSAAEGISPANALRTRLFSGRDRVTRQPERTQSAKPIVYQIIHRGGWTTVIDVAFMHSLIEATQRSVEDAR